MNIKYKIVSKLNSLIINKPLGLAVVLFIPTFTLVWIALFRGSVNFVELKSYVTDAFASRVLRISVEGNAVGPDLESVSAFEEDIKPIYEKPDRLVSKRVGLDVVVESVSVTGDGALETPSAWNRVGWFAKSSKAGEKGNMVINGHYDTNYGGVAAFWVLKNIIVGDTVSVSDSYGRFYDYEVTDSFLVDIEDPNRLEILEDKDGKSVMTLITCGGVWLPQNGTYNKRLVVQAELMQ
jgi:LPXTG-site transpeptidase (sortase) family protein